MREQVIQAVLEGKIIAIVRGVDTDSVVKIAEALYEGGIRMVEVTFNQADPANFHKTADSIRAIREAEPDVLAACPGVSRRDADAIAAYFSAGEKE